MDEYEYLMHHGVKGMKWGVRKSTTSSSRSGRSLSTKRKPAKRPRVEKAKKEKRPRKKVSQMTDAELNDQIKRLKLEKELKNLRKDTQSEGRKFVADVMEKSLKNIATQAATYAIGLALNKAVNKMFGKKHKGVRDGIVNPRKGQKDK